MLVKPPCLTPLFVPADRPERFAKAAQSGADAIILDLEDAVAPAAKAAGRAALAAPGALPPGVQIFIRINACRTPWHEADVAVLAGLAIAGVILPKAETTADLTAVAGRLPGLVLIALLETARGIAAAREIAQCPAVGRLAFGSIDYCADIGAAHTREALLTARCEIVLATRLGGLAPAIDGVTACIDDEAVIEADAAYARGLGFGAKFCIHPRQVAPARRGLAPTETQIAWARRILAAATEGAVSVDGVMVDAPVRARALQIMSRVPGDA